MGVPGHGRGHGHGHGHGVFSFFEFLKEIQRKPAAREARRAENGFFQNLKEIQREYKGNPRRAKRAARKGFGIFLLLKVIQRKYKGNPRRAKRAARKMWSIISAFEGNTKGIQREFAAREARRENVLRSRVSFLGFPW